MLWSVLKISLLCLLPVLAGCAAAVVTGTAPVGNHPASSDAAAREHGHDAEIASRINSRYVEDDLISAFDVKVAVSQGIVTLTGKVRSHRAERRAIELARSVEGVRQLVSKLTVAAY
ncbi:MAG: BON domain-containing protein [Thiogranum sp.]|nr:BON domain-containing protein [Thiogranum sp.]